MKKVILDRAKIAYLREGKKGKPKILMLHGLFANSSYFEETIESLKEDFDILVPDFPGFGISDKLKDTPHTLQTYSDITVKLCDHLLFKPFHLIGASLGGMVSISLADQYPEYVNKLFIQAAPWNKVCINMKFIEKAFDFASRHKKIVRIAGGMKRRVNKEVVSEAIKLFSKHYFAIEERTGSISYCIKMMDLEATAQIWNNLRDSDLSQNAKSITKKTMIIAGDHDNIVFPKKTKYLSRFIKDSEFKLLEGKKYTHSLFFDCPDRMAAIIKKFIL